MHIKDHLSYLEVDYTQAYLQCLIGDEEENDGEDESPPALALPAISVATTSAKIA